MQPGEKITVTGEKLVYGGDCLCRRDEFVDFVPQLMPGETADVVITEQKKGYARAQVARLITPSPARVAPACPYHARIDDPRRAACGGCIWQHIAYPEQLRWKEKIAREIFARFGGEAVAGLSIVGMDDPWRFRHKIQIPVRAERGTFTSGFYRLHSHDIVDIDRCLVQTPLGNEIYARVKTAAAAAGEGARGLRHILIRVNALQTAAQVCCVTRERRFPAGAGIVAALTREHPEVTGIFQNINARDTNVILGPHTVKLRGADTMTDTVGCARYAVAPDAFFQTNPRQTERLYALVAEAAGEGAVVLDLYAGSGGVGIYCASRAEGVICVEENPAAVRGAIRSAAANRLANLRVMESRVEEALPELLDVIPREKTVSVLNPPRAGCQDSVIVAIRRSGIRRVVYISCNPMTLARDMDGLAQAYGLSRLTIVDMFPHSAHMEAVAVLDRK